MPENTTNEADPPVIKITVKEMFDTIQHQLTAIETKLDRKVDLQEFTELQNQVRRLEGADAKRSAVEAALLSKGAVALEAKRWRYPVVLSAVNIAIIFAELLHATIH